MTPRITLIKSYRNKETLRLLELQEVAELISQGEYDDQVSTFRRDLPTMRYAHVSNNGTLEGYELHDPHFYKSYRCTLQQGDWRDFTNADA